MGAERWHHNTWREVCDGTWGWGAGCRWGRRGGATILGVRYVMGPGGGVPGVGGGREVAPQYMA